MKLVKKTSKKDALAWGVHAPPQPRYQDVVTRELTNKTKDLLQDIEKRCQYVSSKDLDNIKKILGDMVKVIDKEKQDKKQNEIRMNF